ncbi:Hint domain-containing protein [Salinihabitans flavidus]|uniref:Hint domain-containing protein n=1 Tax=Salinihabitans flavidus TaxID=569882 RepID=A0A1H8R031_9RHOB|nr:Hint domain-containing protein [Salinihabitans flavidus]SEO59696.1 Hint domain-containing protein [Salinihabitans flavidus]
MPTTYTDQFFVMDPGNPPGWGTSLTPERYDFTDANNDGFIGTGAGDTFNGLTITSVWVGDEITVSMGGQWTNITGVTFYTDGGPAVFTPTDGTVLEDATFRSSDYVLQSTQIEVGEFGPACFTPGTLIETATGLRPVEDLRAGDRIWTLDNGLQSLRWIGREEVAAGGALAPVRFDRGAIGNTSPLLVSPQHRMLITGWQAEMYYGADEVLVAAKHLVNGDTIRQEECETVEYIHLLFDRHEIVFSEGVPTESYYPGSAADRARSAQDQELLALFPELEGLREAETARPVLTRAEAQLLAA